MKIVIIYVTPILLPLALLMLIAAFWVRGREVRLERGDHTRRAGIIVDDEDA